MRVENWDTKLSNYIVKSANKKFRYGKADCVNFCFRWHRNYCR